ncbi:MAG: PLP-dependent transferase, partial [Bifidobacteriaceae bacterium]|nr:PLP-dependent transferase [Bifidobacteriaceae bacterium]
MAHTRSFYADLSPDTAVVAAGRPEWDQGEPVNPPVLFSSTFISRGVPGEREASYSRYDNPSNHPAEQVIGLLEGAPGDGVLFASGMAAIDAALALVPPGGRAVLPSHAYNGTLALARDLATEGRLRLSSLPIDQTADVIASLAGGDGCAPAAMLWIETPTNPLLEIAD